MTAVYAIALLCAVPVLMWLGQAVLLCAAGKPLRWRLSAQDLPRPLKRINRGVTHISFAAALLAYPLLRASTLDWRAPLAYYAGFLPLGPGVRGVAAVGAVVRRGRGSVFSLAAVSRLAAVE